MSIYKRGGVYWYGFVFNGERVQASTKQGNKRVAERMEAAQKTRLAMGEVGLIETKPAPRLREFKPRFVQHVEVRCAEKPRTVAFYKEKLQRLLEYAPMANSRLDRIDEALIEAYVQERRKKVSPGTVNRQLATLRLLLRQAYKWKVIQRVPSFSLLAGEKSRDFVLSHKREQAYLEAAADPLRDVALLILDTGLRVGEAVALQWPDIHFDPVGAAKFGYLRVQSGKSKNACRNVSLTARVSEMLQGRKQASGSDWVFPGKMGRPFGVTSLDHQHEKTRTGLKLPKEFVIHSLRHTMLTRLGEAGADVFTIMRIAGHSSVTVSQRYVHPSPESVERAFERLEALNAGEREKLHPKHEGTTVSTTPPQNLPVSD
jgi:integrase